MHQATVHRSRPSRIPQHEQPLHRFVQDKRPQDIPGTSPVVLPLAVGEKGQGLSMPHCFRPGVNLSGQSMSGLAELDNAPSTTTCGEVSIYAPQQTHAFPMPHLSRTGNNPHPLSRARAGANRALHPLPRSRPQRARNSLANARSSLATQSSQTRRHERLVRPLEEPALVLRRASLTRLRVQMRRWLSP